MNRRTCVIMPVGLTVQAAQCNISLTNLLAAITVTEDQPAELNLATVPGHPDIQLMTDHLTSTIQLFLSMMATVHILQTDLTTSPAIMGQ